MFQEEGSDPLGEMLPPAQEGRGLTVEERSSGIKTPPGMGDGEERNWSQQVWTALSLWALCCEEVQRNRLVAGVKGNFFLQVEFMMVH